MSAIDPTSNGPEVRVGPTLLGDARLGYLLAEDARQRVVTRALGVPRDEQSLLLALILAGTAVGVLRGLAPQPWPRPSGSDVAAGGSLLNVALHGIAGTPARTMPFAGALIAFAVVSHSLRPAVVGSVREVRAVAHGVRTAFSARYGGAKP